MTLPLVVIAGPTGTGKSELALDVAERIGGEIVNFDSVQIYRGFDIGSAKPTPEQRGRVPHHLVDIADADQEINAADFGLRARAVCEEIRARDKRPVLVGGTFFYLRAILSGLPEMPGRDDEVRRRIHRIASTSRGSALLHRWLSRVDPQSAGRIAVADRHRVERALEVWITSGRPISSWNPPTGNEELPAVKIALSLPRPDLVRRLDERVVTMFQRGLLDETRELLVRYSPAARPFSSIGYREAAAVVRGEQPLEQAIAETQRRTRAYAKRQMTWLRSERNVQWLDASDREHLLPAALRLIEVER